LFCNLCSITTTSEQSNVARPHRTPSLLAVEAREPHLIQSFLGPQDSLSTTGRRSVQSFLHILPAWQTSGIRIIDRNSLHVMYSMLRACLCRSRRRSYPSAKDQATRATSTTTKRNHFAYRRPRNVPRNLPSSRAATRAFERFVVYRDVSIVVVGRVAPCSCALADPGRALGGPRPPSHCQL